MRDRAAESADRPHRANPPAPLPLPPAPVAQSVTPLAEPRQPDYRPDAILGLQRLGGNHAVQRLLGAVRTPPPRAIQRQSTPHTITNPRAAIRGGPDDFKPTGNDIPVGTRVDVTKREVVDTKKLKGDFVEVSDHATGAAIGWTARENLGDVQYANAAASFVYVAKVQPRKGHPDTIPVMVYVPPKFDGTKADIVLYLHGDAADFSADTANNYSRENPAIGMKLSAVASGPTQIVIAPQINEYTPSGSGQVTGSPWQTLHAGDFDTIVQTALTNLQGDLNLAAPIPRGAISIAGHSGGGKGLGQAAKDLAAGADAVTDVTLVEAGYRSGEDKSGNTDDRFGKSMQMVREWLLAGKPGKVLRVITKETTVGNDTRHVIENQAGDKPGRIPILSLEGVKRAIKAAGRENDLDAVATDIKTDPQTRTGGMTLVRTIVVTPKTGGPPQGTIDVFLMLDPPRDPGVDKHFGVRDATIGAIASGGGKTDTFGVP